MEILGESSTAIVADDHELFRDALARLLRREFSFNQVIEAGSLDELMELLGGTPDVTFASVDLAMPHMNGAMSLQSIRERYPSVRIAVVTGSERREDILLALRAGVHGFIPKTFRISEIDAALKAVIEGSLFVPPTVATTVASSRSSVGEMREAVQEPTALKRLSPRQKDVLSLMAEGMSNKEIARGLGLAEGTVKVHVAALFRALGAHNRVSAVAGLTQINGQSRP